MLGVGGHISPFKRNKIKNSKYVKVFKKLGARNFFEKMRKKLTEILLTALLSAGIATLQALASQYLGHQIPSGSPETAGIVGAIIHSIRKFS